MNRYGFALLILGIVAIATWAYNVNYDTKAVLKRVGGLRTEIAAERERAQVLRVEWAYLNAPDRLIDLVARHQDRLGLVPVGAAHLRPAAAPPYPPRDTGDTGTVTAPAVPVPPERPVAVSLR